MKRIATPINGQNQIDGHFGHCEYYAVYSISEEEHNIIDVQIIKAEQGCGCKSNIASVLSDLGVTVMLAGGIGAGAINVLNMHGIEVIRGCEGEAGEAVKQYLQGQVKDSGTSCQQHEQHHQQGHSCSH